MCQRQDHRNRFFSLFFFFLPQMWAGDNTTFGMRLSLAWGERWGPPQPAVQDKSSVSSYRGREGEHFLLHLDFWWYLCKIWLIFKVTNLFKPCLEITVSNKTIIPCCNSYRPKNSSEDFGFEWLGRQTHQKENWSSNECHNLAFHSLVLFHPLMCPLLCIYFTNT